MKIVLATRNKGKIAELGPAFASLGHELASLDDFPDFTEPEESGADFEENALIKARAAAKATGLPAIADDSGLMADALYGAPGVFSARFADDWEFLPGESRDQRNMRKLLHLLAGVPRERRGCRFATVMACAMPDGREMTVRGEWRGELLESPLGANGFGYDPIFWDPELGRSAAQLSRAEKNSRSHRGKAAALLLERLPAFLAGGK